MQAQPLGSVFVGNGWLPPKRICARPAPNGYVGCARTLQFWSRSAHLCLTSVIVGRDRLLEPSDVLGLKFLGELDGGRNLKRAVRVDHQFDVGAKPAASRLTPAH